MLLSELCRKLDEIAQDNQGEAVLLQWACFLHDEAGPALNIGDPLRLRPLEGLADCTLLDMRAQNSCATAAEAWQVLLRHNDEGKRRSFIAKHHTCSVCLEDVARSRAVLLASCAHVFCKSCIAAMCDVQISDGAVQFVRCPDCGENLLPSDIEPLVDAAAFARYEDFTLKRALEGMEDLAWCPRCQGPVIKVSPLS